MFQYAPNDAPSAGDIPDRARQRSTEALWRWLRSLPGNEKGTTPCAGSIKLVASVTPMSVKDTITELRDESGRTWWTMGHEDRDRVRDSIPLEGAGVSATPPR